MDIKWKEFDTLKKRLIKFKNYIEEAENVLKNIIIPEINRRNNNMRKESQSGKNLSAGFYVSTKLEEALKPLFSSLNYANLINIEYNRRSLGHNQTGYLMYLNPSLLFTELILKDFSEFYRISPTTKINPNYYATSEHFKDLLSALHVDNEFVCSNENCNYSTTDASNKFCPKCGSKIQEQEEESLYKILREHSISNLPISNFLIGRTTSKYAVIGQVYDATMEDIKTIYQVGDVRSEKIKNSAIEYMAG